MHNDASSAAYSSRFRLTLMPRSDGSLGESGGQPPEAATKHRATALHCHVWRPTAVSHAARASSIPRIFTSRRPHLRHETQPTDTSTTTSAHQPSRRTQWLSVYPVSHYHLPILSRLELLSTSSCSSAHGNLPDGLAQHRSSHQPILSEARLRDLRPRRGDRLVCVGVGEPTPCLAALELRALRRTDAIAVLASTAPGCTVCIVDAGSRDELRPVAPADVACTLNLFRSLSGLRAVLRHGDGGD